MDFVPFQKIPRLNRDCVISEKIDGTNGQIWIVPTADVGFASIAQQYGMETGESRLFAGSRSRYLTCKEDNHGFFKWVSENREELVKQLGYGQHFGEWWGAGINKRYKDAPKTFSLFNTLRWTPAKEGGLLTVCNVVPVLYEGRFCTVKCNEHLQLQREYGSLVWPGAQAEGIVVYHKGSGLLFKATCEKDEKPKGME